VRTCSSQRAPWRIALAPGANRPRVDLTGGGLALPICVARGGLVWYKAQVNILRLALVRTGTLGVFSLVVAGLACGGGAPKAADAPSGGNCHAQAQSKRDKADGACDDCGAHCSWGSESDCVQGCKARCDEERDGGRHPGHTPSSISNYCDPSGAGWTDCLAKCGGVKGCRNSWCDGDHPERDACHRKADKDQQADLHDCDSNQSGGGGCGGKPGGTDLGTDRVDPKTKNDVCAVCCKKDCDYMDAPLDPNHAKHYYCKY
jgi:hypothetical protein